MEQIEKIWPQYKVVELLGEGTYGKVFKVRREELDSVYYSAVKLIELPRSEAEEQELRASGMSPLTVRAYFEDIKARMVGEIQTMERLKASPNVVRLEDFRCEERTDRVGWTLYIRMELLTSLTAALNTQGSRLRTPAAVQKLGMDICGALELCQQKNIIHRDIKPGNIFVDELGTFKLGDFGQARTLDSLGGASTYAGSDPYMAPEVYRKKYGQGENYDHRADIYSLGITLYRILNGGRPPFVPPDPRPQDFEEGERRRLAGEPLPPPAGGGLLGAVVRKACAFRPQDRYQSAAEFRRALEECAAGAPQASPAAPEQTQWNGGASAVTAAHRAGQPDARTASAAENLREKAFTAGTTFGAMPNPVPGENLQVDTVIPEDLAAAGGLWEVACPDPAGGAGKLPRRISIPAGILEGETLCFAGGGMPGSFGGRDGDLYVTLHIRRKADAGSVVQEAAEEAVPMPEAAGFQLGLKPMGWVWILATFAVVFFYGSREGSQVAVYLYILPPLLNLLPALLPTEKKPWSYVRGFLVVAAYAFNAVMIGLVCEMLGIAINGWVVLLLLVLPLFIPDMIYLYPEGRSRGGKS